MPRLAGMRSLCRKLGSREEHFEFFAAEGADEGVVGGDDGVGELAFVLLEGDDFFFDRVLGDEAAGVDSPGLADAVGAVDGLLLDGGVPPGVEEEDVVGGGEVEAEAAGFEADEEELAVVVILEVFDAGGTVAGFAVEVFVADFFFVQMSAEDGEHAGELGEDERFVAFVDDFRQLRQKDAEFGAGLGGA